jgi:hypothetical protein
VRAPHSADLRAALASIIKYVSIGVIILPDFQNRRSSGGLYSQCVKVM